MRAVRVDPVNRTATAQGGALWGDYDHETQAFGLASPGGAVSTTGVAGLTLGGGIGWLTRKLGLACDSLIGADLVTSEGALKLVSEESDPDLMWAIKGGGGNFGIATSLHFRVHPVGPIVLGGPIIYSIEHAAEVYALVDEMSNEAPDDLAIAIITCPVKPTPMFPEELHWRPVVIVLLCWSGDLTAGERFISPFRQIAPAIMDFVAPIPYANLQKNYDSLVPKGRRSYWKSGYLQNMDSEVAGRLIKYGRQPLSPYSQVEAVLLGGKFSRIAPEASAFGDRSGVAVYNLECFWLDAMDDKANIEWARAAFRDLEQFSTGTAYVNFLSDEGDERVRASYTASYTRLSQIKARMDPDNFFRINHNIPPASAPVQR
jgi:FAD/FMN-containing dehydrogenase